MINKTMLCNIIKIRGGGIDTFQLIDLSMQISASKQNHQRNHVEVDELRGRERKSVKKKLDKGHYSPIK